MKALVYCITASLAIEYFDRNGKIDETDFRAQIPDYPDGSVSFSRDPNQLITKRMLDSSDLIFFTLAHLIQLGALSRNYNIGFLVIESSDLIFKK